MPISILIRSAGRTEGTGAGGKAASPLPRLTFDGARLVIGRGPGCEVRLPDPSVSQRHATVRVDGAVYALLDEGSTNGTFVGNVRLSPGAPRTLRDGDVIRVGRVWLEIRFDQSPATLDLPTATRDVAFHLVEDAMRAIGEEVSPRIQVVEGPDRGRVLALEEDGRTYLAGRGEGCDLLLDDADGSRQHLQIVRRAASVLVRDVGSKNGAWLGEAQLPKDRDIVWRGPTMLRVGQNVLALEEPVAEALAELEAGPDEALPDDGAPPKPPDLAPPAQALQSGGALARLAAERPKSATVEPRLKSRQRGWSGADLAVVVAAISILALSAVGLYWLLRG